MDFLSGWFGSSEPPDTMDSIYASASAGSDPSGSGAEQEALGAGIVQESLGTQIVNDTRAGLQQEALGTQIVTQASADWLAGFGNTAAGVVKSLALPIGKSVLAGASAGMPGSTKKTLFNSYSNGPTLSQLLLGIGAVGVLAFMVGKK